MGAEDFAEEGRRATFLGADYAAGRRRQVWHRHSQAAKRIKAAKKRRWRVNRFWLAAGDRARKVARTGLIPQAGFGTAITGLSNADLEELRRLQETGTGGRRRGRSMARQRLVDGDPAAELATAPIVEWAKEVRSMHHREKGALTRGEIATYWQAAKARKVKRWADTKGPADVTKLSLERINWQWPSPWMFKDERGLELDMTIATPALLQWHLAARRRRQLEAQVGKALATRGWQETGQAVSSAVARRMLAEQRLDKGSKGIIRSLALGSWWTTGGWAKAGYKIDDKCPLCQSVHEDDTIWHRLWRCPATKDLRQTPAMTKVTKRALQAGPKHLLYSTGLLANPEATAPGPSEVDLGDQLAGEAPWQPD